MGPLSLLALVLPLNTYYHSFIYQYNILIHLLQICMLHLSKLALVHLTHQNESSIMAVVFPAWFTADLIPKIMSVFSKYL